MDQVLSPNTTHRTDTRARVLEYAQGPGFNNNSPFQTNYNYQFKMQSEDSPPQCEDQDEDFDEEEMIYVGDVDEVLDELEGGSEQMEEEPDDAMTVFNQHKKSVFCGCLTNDGKIAATGGEDDTAYIWNTTSGEVIHKCSGHNDSVICSEFSHDNSYLATADMKGILQVWRMSDKNCIWNFNMGDASWVRWHNMANVLFAGSVEGEIYMWKIPSGECKVFQGFGQKTETATVIADGKRLVAGYEDGAIRVMDLKEGTIAVTIAANAAHSAPITALDCQSDGKLIISAAVDGRTVLSTISTGKIVAVLQYLPQPARIDDEEDEEDDEESRTNRNWVEAVAFCKNPDLHLVASGTLQGEIFVWDTVKQTIRHTITQESGVSKLVWKGTSPFLFSAGLDGIIRCYDARTGQGVKQFWGHSEDILDLWISKDGTKVLTTSDDTTARIFDITNC